MYQIVIDFITGGILTALITSVVYNYTDKKATRFMGFLYGGPIIFAYLIYRIFISNGIHHAQIFARYTILGVLTSFLMIAPWYFITVANMKNLFAYSILYILIVYLIIFPLFLKSFTS